ncbi:glutaredoxin 3 [Neisseriaceae bacterium B1]
MAHIKMYTGAFCPYCSMAKQFLAQLGHVEIEEIRVDGNAELFTQMQQLSGQRSIPQIFIDDKHIGGFTDLRALHQKGELEPLLNA